MKRKGKDRRVLLAGIGGVMAGSFLAAGKASAGVLNPPSGSPSPTGRSLSDIEPRTPVDSLTGSGSVLHAIINGGAYKLTRDLTLAPGQVGIDVRTTDPVAIDLNGFTIKGSGGGGGGAGGAIRVSTPGPGCAYLEVFDGFIRDVDGDGIDGGTAHVLEVYDVHIDNARRGVVGGCGGGNFCNAAMIVESSIIERCTQDGILWTRSAADASLFIVDDSECRACSGNGITVTGDFSVGGGTLSITDTDVVGNLGDGLSIDVSSSSGGGAGGQFSARIQAVRATINSGAGLRVHATSPLGTSPSLVLQCEDVMCTGNSTGMDLEGVSVDCIDCVSSKNQGDGARWGFCNGTVDACTAMDNGGDGLHLTSACRMSVNDIAAHGNGGSGLHLDVSVTGVSVTDGDVRDNAIGMRTQSPGNLLLRNTALQNGQNYVLEPTTPVVIVTFGQLQQSNNPHANYSG